jgi:hypothetical protein
VKRGYSVCWIPSGLIDRSDTTGCRLYGIQFYLRNRTTAHRADLLGCTVNNLVEFWVCKVSQLKRHQSNQKGKKWNNAHFCSEEENSIRSVALHHIDWTHMGCRVNPNSILSKESNCRLLLGSFELKLLKEWVNFKFINLLTRRDTWYNIFKKTCPRYPLTMGPLLTL